MIMKLVLMLKFANDNNDDNNYDNDCENYDNDNNNNNANNINCVFYEMDKDILHRK